MEPHAAYFSDPAIVLLRHACVAMVTHVALGSHSPRPCYPIFIPILLAMDAGFVSCFSGGTFRGTACGTPWRLGVENSVAMMCAWGMKQEPSEGRSKVRTGLLPHLCPGPVSSVKPLPLASLPSADRLLGKVKIVGNILSVELGAKQEEAERWQRARKQPRDHSFWSKGGAGAAGAGELMGHGGPPRSFLCVFCPPHASPIRLMWL